MRKKGRRLIALMLVAATLFCMRSASGIVYWGQQGDQVYRVQQKLKQYGYFSGAVDGHFGQETYDAVVWFQRKNGLKADGVVGNATAAALGITLEEGGSVQAAATESESYLLARLVHGEARGEPYTGKVAVAAVVLNRVRSASFPNTISGVIFEAGAFDCVYDGQLWLTPDSESIRAANDALAGWDPTGGCLYYYNPSTATSAWIWTREVRLNIGAHAFAV
ncbi:MAG: spore cortex-lytic enzyme [Clostridia bacterium]|nr:spore cortex-lytic enzyme [Clostridia bacterium]MBR6787350.1 spore cortex-lytic enzyme [Clostridia bacterium]